MLGAVLGSHDDQLTIDEPGIKVGEHPTPLGFGERAASSDVVPQLDPAVRGVHGLAARAGRAGEALGELPGGDRQSFPQAGSGGESEVAHGNTVARSVGLASELPDVCHVRGAPRDP
jgi:hypothetical protein